MKGASYNLKKILGYKDALHKYINTLFLKILFPKI